jgi:uncharacterized membrane protein
MFARFSRWLPLLFLASLAGNVFLGGIMVADRRPTASPGSDPVRALDRVVAQLPADDAAIVRRAIDGRGQILAAERDRRKDFRHAVSAVLRAEPFDREALVRVIDAYEKEEAVFRQRMRAGFIDAASTVSADARRQIADLAEKSVPHER